ncbi:uncharacterized protein B0P05DRAFT_540398 [Gilbertella persicaria]|uniref:uncharacterized protein n=1 Tax=Gilbertella persicaria TaxID=101096 RepID=UPI00221E8B90|nr:uncharacterized protein B0P05DRAFT_540398 [Gilbertella persicaria]KAI8080199.1 hypothetical protein B0P05DRAFT_540398 [Gilbertella persicaria]
METLPFEVAIKVVSFLSIKDLKKIAVINRYWNILANVRLYKHLIIKTEKQLNLFIQWASQRTQSYVQCLDLTHVHGYVTDRTLDTLMYATNIRQLNLAKCTRLSPESILPLIKNNVSWLHTLILTDCTLSNEVIQWIGEASRQQLKCLNLSNTMIKPCLAFDTSNHLDNMFHSTNVWVAQLRYLDLSYCAWVNEKTVENIAHGLPYLEHIILQWCNQIKVNSVHNLVQQLTFLNTIDIRHIDTVSTEEQASHVMEYAASLKKILFTYKTNSTEIVSLK